jgi:uncharacterized protein (TIGR00297 family)
LKISASEWKRKAVHAGMGVFALALRWLTWEQAAALAAAAVAFNLFAMPRIGRSLYRNAAARHDAGIVAYPSMVLLLVLLFRDRYAPIAAAVWGMMAFGDPAAALFGKRFGGPALPWNRDKRWIGFFANWAFGGTAAVLFFAFVSQRRVEPPAAALLVAGAALFAFLESVRAGIDDNLVAALPTALALAQAALVWPDFGASPAPLARLALGIAVNAAVALATLRLGVVAGSGAAAGALVGTAVVVFGGWTAYALLWTFFLLGTLATKWGYGRKAAAGVAQGASGRRGAAHVLANCGVPAALLVLGAHPVGYAAAFAAALADTLGTEFGALYGRHAFSPIGGRPLPVGTPGAISWPGTLAAFAGAALVGAAAALLGWISGALVWLVALAGLAGALAESVANDVGRRVGFKLDHEFANALNTFVGALVALEVRRWLAEGFVYLPVFGA